MNGPYLLDKTNGKLMGVCAGLSRSTGVDPTIVRLLTIVLTLVAGPITVLFYLIAGMIAPQG